MKPYYQEKNITIYLNDNLELLKTLESKSINLIYCDVLYNTEKQFDDYNDNLGSPMEAIEWYRPRINEMKRVLTDNGSIFLHCNWRLDSYLRILMDEIFGRENYRNAIHRKHSQQRGFFKNFDSQMDTILYYVKNPNDFIFNEIKSDKPIIAPLFENGYLEGRSETRIINNQKIDLGSLNKHWLVSPHVLNRIIDNNEIRIIDDLPYRDTTIKPIGNLWDEPEMLDTYPRTSKSNTYDTPKPEAVLNRIITICSNEGDTVADFFLGGGTTAVVTQKLNRKGIFCDISKKACNITIDKLKRLN